MQSKYLGPFRIFEVIGRGGMGAVYEAVHTETHEKVAIKVLLFPIEEDEELRLRFEVEIETLKKLRHQNIVRLFGFGEEQPVIYYVMEFIDGQSLQQELRKKRFFTWGEVCKIGLEISQALKHAHDRGIIHRDIKPANILLEYSGDVKLSDFGIAHIYGANRLTSVNSVVGTLEYMSPEQSLAGPIGPKTDLYSLGAVLYTLLAGTPPHQAKTLAEILQKHQSGPPPKISTIRPDVPEAFEAIITELLNIKPENRPTNAYILTRRLQTVLKAYIGNPGLIKVFPSEKITGPPTNPVTHTPSQLEETSTQYRAAANLPSNLELPISLNDNKPSQSDSSTGESKKRRSILHGKSRSQMSLDDFKYEISSPSKIFKKRNRTEGGKKSTGEIGRAERLRRLLSERHFTKWRETSAIARKQDLFSHDEKKSDLTRPLKRSPESPQDSRNSESHFRISDKPHVDPEAKQPAQKSINPLDILGDTANTPSDTSKKLSRFVRVSEDELGGFSKYEASAPRSMISVQTIFLSICLLGIGFFIYYLLQPIPADTLYNRIIQAIGADNENGDISRIVSAKNNIELFLDLYPNDPRREQMYRYIEEIKLDKVQRDFDLRINRLQNIGDLEPLDQICLEAFTLARTQPEKAAVKFQAILDLYGSDLAPPDAREEISSESNTPEENLETKTNPDDRREGRPRSESQIDLRLELVRRRLVKIQEQSTSQKVEDQKSFLQSRLDMAAEIHWIFPEQADAIRNGVIEIYRDKPWAAPFVERAQDELNNEDDE